jgi:DNA-binding response OmpR family regulator
VLASMKRHSNWLSAPVIMLTGMRSTFHVETAKASGAYDVLEKPMALDEWFKIPGQIESGLVARFCSAAAA